MPNEDLYEDLLEAFELGNLEALNNILENKEIQKIVDDEAIITLSKAATAGHLEVVKRLLEIPAVYAAVIHDPSELLGDIAHLGDLAQDNQSEVFKHIISIKEVIDSIEHWGEQVLGEACGGGSLEIVNCLLENPKMQPFLTSQNNFPFFAAAVNGQTLILKRLLEFKEVAAAAIVIQAIAPPGPPQPNTLQPIVAAATNGHLEVVREILKIPGIIPAILCRNIPALKLAAARGSLEIVNLFLDIPVIARYLQIYHEIQAVLPTHLAIKYNSHLPSHLALIVDGYEGSELNNALAEAFLHAAMYGHLPIINLFTPEVILKALGYAAIKGYALVVDRLLMIIGEGNIGKNRIDILLENAAGLGYLSVVNRFLEIPGVKAAIEPFQQILIDICNGKLDEVNVFLEDPENLELIEENENSHEVLNAAVRNGQEVVLSRILEIDIVKNAAIGNDYLMCLAVLGGFLPIIEILLNSPGNEAIIKLSDYPRIGFQANVPQTHLSVAAFQGHIQVVERLLQEEWDEQQVSHAFFGAASQGHLPVIERFLRSNNEDNDEESKNDVENSLLHKTKDVAAMVSFCGNSAFLEAVENGHLAVVKRLLEHPKVMTRVGVLNGLALRTAAGKGHYEIVELLLKIPRALEKLTAADHKALRNAVEEGHLKVVLRLLKEYQKLSIPFPKDVVIKGYESLNAFVENFRVYLETPHAVLTEYFKDAAQVIEDYAHDNKQFSFADYRRIFLAPDTPETIAIKAANREAAAREQGRIAMASAPMSGSSAALCFSSASAAPIYSGSVSSYSSSDSASSQSASSLRSVESPSWASLSSESMASKYSPKSDT